MMSRGHFDEPVERIEAPFGNYYGRPAIAIYGDGGAHLCIEDYDGWRPGVPVSRSFAEAFIREFGDESHQDIIATLAPTGDTK